MERMPGEIEKVYGPRVKRLRVKLGYSQGSLATALDMSLGRIAAIEQAEEESMYLDNFRALAGLAKMSIDELRGAIGVNPHKPLSTEEKRLAARVKKSAKGDKAG